MPTDMNRERDILLAPNEYAYVQDLTKGTIDLNVGPTKVSLSNTERMVEYNHETGRFTTLEERLAQDKSLAMDRAHLDKQRYQEMVPEGKAGVQRFVLASSSQYVVLENPTKEEAKYARGANASAELKVGKKVVVPGPVTMPLWPGQAATVIDGHRLAEDEYLLIRTYDIPEGISGQGNEKGDAQKQEGSNHIHIGMEQIVKGSQNRFYIPSNGFEVVPQEDGSYVRKAVKLMDGEYCILLNPNGEKKYVRGPNMVIPEPNETLISATDGGKAASGPVMKAQTLKPEKGLHLYVTRDFDCKEDDQVSEIIDAGSYKTGQELFISGKEGLFFPSENLQILGEVHPLSIAENEGIYVQNFKTGEINTVRGPKNFLADPTRQRVLHRSLDEKTERLYNITDRENANAISVYVPPNHAVMVVSDKERKVVQGPRTYILDYAENLETLALSTGTPKNDKSLLSTVYLQIEGNKVSDVVPVETQDHVKLNVKMSYRISFEKEPEKWFNVNNYVGLLCDHLSSLVRSSVQRHPLEKFYSNSTDVIRDSILGLKKEGEKRVGREFVENNMKVYDLEVLSVDVLDPDVKSLLTSSQGSAFKMEMEKRQVERQFDFTAAKEDIAQKTNALKVKSIDSEMSFVEKDNALRNKKVSLELAIDKFRREGFAANEVEEKRIKEDFERNVQDHKQEKRIELMDKETNAYKERMAAFGPDFVAALTRYGDQELILKASEHLSELSVLEGKSVQETLMALFKGLPFLTKNLEFALPHTKTQSTKSDAAKPEGDG